MCIQVFIRIENENDNVPLTEQPVYYPSIPENSPPGTRIIKLEASDDDIDAEQKISYKLISGNPEGFFAINSTTGNENFLGFVSYSFFYDDDNKIMSLYLFHFPPSSCESY